MKFYPCSEKKEGKFPIRGDELKDQAEGVYQCEGQKWVVAVFRNWANRESVAMLACAEGEAVSANGALDKMYRYRLVENAKVCLEIVTA
jgi:hypothetical protein